MRPLRLLIVEDNPGVRRLIAGVVSTIASEVFECSDGADAVGAYEAWQPDAVFMDNAMNGKDGISATTAIVAAHPDACVVMVTDYDDADLREAASAAGAYGYVVKDNLLELRGILEELQHRISRLLP
jgi:CheY-like chemotaxis protein